MKLKSNILWLLPVFFYLGVIAQEKQDSTRAILKKEILRTHKTSIKAFPYVYYTPETELAFGVGGIITFYTSEYRLLRPSKLTLSGYYSTRKQYKITLAPELYMARNSLFLSTNLNFGEYVDKFWGIGNDTPDIENEDYDSRSWGVLLSFQFPPLLKFMPQNKSGIIFDYYDYMITNPRDNPFLLSGEITGSKGGISSGIGLALVWDTRNQIFYPTKGGFYQAKAIYYLKTIGSTYDFNFYEVDLRKYLGFKGSSVLAFQIFASFARGTPPFYELSMLGGSHIMRGYFQGRYRDKNYLAGQAEYRTALWRRFGLVVFAGLGDVESELRNFRIRDAKVSSGFGFRFLFDKNQKINIRVDFGFGRDTRGVYFGLEEAF
jgi:outer membrane protein assembly factor BamA